MKPLFKLIVVLAASCTTAVGESGQPNFVIIYADDLGYGDLGCFGSTTIKTPNIDRMAAEGMKLKSFYAQTVCGPSRASLMTGCYPMRVANHKNTTFIHPILDQSEITVAEVLREVGYRSIAIGKWSLGQQGQKVPYPQLMPTHQGFDKFFGTPGSNDNLVNLVRGDKIVENRVDMSQLSRRYTDEAIGFIKQHNSQERHSKPPFFVYVAHTMPHIRLAVSKEFRGKSAGGLFGDVVEELDFHVGRILKTLKEEGLDEQTYVIFTSDNGPWYLGRSKGHLKKYGDQAIAQGGTAFPLRGDKTNAWEGGLRVPCVVRAPGKIAAGSESDAITGLIDILPTFANLAGAKVPVDRVIDGLDISPLLTDEISGTTAAMFRDRPFFYYIRTRVEAVRLGNWKLHVPRPVDKEWGKYAKKADDVPITEPTLFDLKSDIGETTNVAKQHPEVVAKLMRLIKDARRDIGDFDRLGENARFVDGFPRPSAIQRSKGW